MEVCFDIVLPRVDEYFSASVCFTVHLLKVSWLQHLTCVGACAPSTTQTDQMNPGESFDPLLMSLKSTSISVDEWEETEADVKEGFLSLETSETWIAYVCHSEGEWARLKI